VDRDGAGDANVDQRALTGIGTKAQTYSHKNFAHTQTECGTHRNSQAHTSSRRHTGSALILYLSDKLTGTRVVFTDTHRFCNSQSRILYVSDLAIYSVIHSNSILFLTFQVFSKKQKLKQGLTLFLEHKSQTGGGDAGDSWNDILPPHLHPHPPPWGIFFLNDCFSLVCRCLGFLRSIVPVEVGRYSFGSNKLTFERLFSTISVYMQKRTFSQTFLL
jgi:hypothetical protein